MPSGGPMRTGVLVLRVWMEGEPEGQPRARLTATHDISDPRPAAVTVMGRDEVCAAVRAWLEDFAHGRREWPDPPGDDRVTDR